MDTREHLLRILKREYPDRPGMFRYLKSSLDIYNKETPETQFNFSNLFYDDTVVVLVGAASLAEGLIGEDSFSLDEAWSYLKKAKKQKYCTLPKHQWKGYYYD